MNKDIDYIGPYRMKSEAYLYSTITLNGNPYRVADAVGATADGLSRLERRTRLPQGHRRRQTPLRRTQGGEEPPLHDLHRQQGTQGQVVKHMKRPSLRFLLTAAAVGFATLVLALDSGNVIGYQSQRIVKGKNVFTTPFMNDFDAGRLTQSLGSLLPTACEGDVIEFNDFKAEARIVDGVLHWISNKLTVDGVALPPNGVAITYTRKADTSTDLEFAGEVHMEESVEPLGSKPVTPIEVKEVRPKRQFFLADILSYSTIQVICFRQQGEISTGTGFFYNFSLGDGRYIPAILTNRHVVDGSAVSVLTFSTAKNGLPQDEKVKYVTRPDRNRWHGHDDPTVDLCFLPLLPIIDHFAKEAKQLHITPFSREFIPDAEYLSGITQLDDVAMIGYPNGIWDEVNNQPIFRKGSLATRPNKNYKGKREFVIDMPVYGGSSGSPVLLATDMPHIDRIKHSMQYHGRVKLLGVVSKTFLHTTTGDIKAVPITTLNSHGTNYTAQVSVPNNLGIVINASRILEIEDSLRRVFAEPPKTDVK